jgi:hypothetical protein
MRNLKTSFCISEATYFFLMKIVFFLTLPFGAFTATFTLLTVAASLVSELSSLHFWWLQPCIYTSLWSAAIFFLACCIGYLLAWYYRVSQIGEDDDASKRVVMYKGHDIILHEFKSCYPKILDFVHFQ